MALNIKIGDVITNVKILEIYTHGGSITRRRFKVEYLCCNDIKNITYSTIVKRKNLNVSNCLKCARNKRKKITLKKDKILINHFTDDENIIYNMWKKYK